ncbi:hypothetical protein D3C87_1510810 [compost metagenome]
MGFNISIINKQTVCKISQGRTNRVAHCRKVLILGKWRLIIIDDFVSGIGKCPFQAHEKPAPKVMVVIKCKVYTLVAYFSDIAVYPGSVCSEKAWNTRPFKENTGPVFPVNIENDIDLAHEIYVHTQIDLFSNFPGNFVVGKP